MGYRVDYEPVNRTFRVKQRRMLRVPLLSAIFFAVFLLLVRCFWVQGSQTLGLILFPGDLRVVGQALETLADQLREGASISNTVQVFCREIIQEAGIGIG